MKIPANVIDQLVTGAQSDIRQVVNMLSTWKLSSDSMDFDEGKTLYDSRIVYHFTIHISSELSCSWFGPWCIQPDPSKVLRRSVRRPG